MTLKDCLEIGKECGLTTLKECYDNIYYHATSLFAYKDINKELLELQKDIFKTDKNKFCELFNATIKEMEEKGW